MIVPMKKAAIITQSKDASSAIDRLRSLGLLHVEHQQAPRSKDISGLKSDIAFVDSALRILSQEEFLEKKCPPGPEEPKDWKFSARHIVDSWKRLDRLREYSRALKAQISQWAAWGEFDPADIKALAAKNIFVRLYRIPVREMNSAPARTQPLCREAGRRNRAKQLPEGVVVRTLFAGKGVAHCAIISRAKADIPFEEVPLPKMSLKSMRERLAEDTEVMESIKEDIGRHTCYSAFYQRVKTSLEKELEFQEALRGMGEAGRLMYIMGYIPHDGVDPLLAEAKKEKWGVSVVDPSEEDNVPTLIRNPKWVSIISPIFKVIEITPGYHELDISFWFLVFFSVFFGMLIGDAAYGIIFFLITLWANKKWGRQLKDKSVFILFYILSSCAVVWGVLSGTFFGQEWLPKFVHPIIGALRQDTSVESLCFFIGALQISVGHLWRALRKAPSATALGDIGCVLIIWGAFFLANMLILDKAFPSFAKWLLIAGAVLVISFTSPGKNVLKSFGIGLSALFSSVIGSFTDIVSYIRLFAVGLATVAIADAFNSMALDVGYNNVIRGAVMAVILIFGHMLNIILGPLAILVHGVRLNVLEFCNHVDVKWSGFPYKPLGRIED